MLIYVHRINTLCNLPIFTINIQASILHENGRPISEPKKTYESLVAKILYKQLFMYLTSIFSQYFAIALLPNSLSFA